MAKESHLPVAAAADIQQLSADYDMAAKHGVDTKDSLIRLIWALVHSAAKKDNRLGVGFCRNLIKLEPREKQQLLYLLAVGEYKLGNGLQAREVLRDLLKQWPAASQAKHLLDVVEDEITGEALVVGGTLAAVGGVAALIIGALVAGSKR